MVSLVALLAVGFFGPSLPLAGVPFEDWPFYASVAGVAGIVLAGSFFVSIRRADVAVMLAVIDASVVAALGWIYRDHYHQIGLLYMLIVCAHGVVHGLRPALVVALMGSVFVPILI